MKCGLVGFPNVGKSTIFNLLAKKMIAHADNYPFCTIEPNSTQVIVLDLRLEKLAAIAGSKKIVYPQLSCVDIAGLIEGASKGEGLGNKFLSHIREVDIILHVVRAFDDTSVIKVNNYSPIQSAKCIELELLLADLEVIEKRLNSRKLAPQEKSVLQKAASILSNEQTLQVMPQKDKLILKQLNLLTLKPMIYVINCDEKFSTTEFTEYAKINDRRVTYCNPLIDDDVSNIISVAYEVLQLHSFFTVGPKEARGWKIRCGDTILQAAGVIHTDFMEKFKKAETISFQNFVQHGFNAAKKGAMKVVGKDYIVQDGDIIMIKI